MLEVIVGKKSLNPKIWDGTVLKPDVEELLLKIAHHFAEYLDIPKSMIKDIIFTGSMAHYHYGPKSDIDVHLVVDYKDIDENVELVRKLLRAKKSLYNNRHDIKIKGYDVELYPQDESEPHHSTGIYSVVNGEWIAQPVPHVGSVDKQLVNRKAESLVDSAKSIFSAEDPQSRVDKLQKFKDKIINMRRSGLQKDGEFSVENLVFKELRNNGFLEKLLKTINKSIDKTLSLDEMEEFQRASIKLNKINIPILLGYAKKGDWRPSKKNKKVKPYIHKPKPNYLSAPPGAPGG
tara:strand:+ start:1462 stop:2334 length:873 start_codon:yes stop_codon:yes gene_type:complete